MINLQLFLEICFPLYSPVSLFYVSIMVIEDDIGDWEFSQYNDPILVLSANIIILRKALCDIIVKITLNSTAFNV